MAGGPARTVRPSVTAAEAIRGHWRIETTSHYTRDVTMGEDRSRIRAYPGVAARLRSFGFNILKANRVGTLAQDRYRAALGGLKACLNADNFIALNGRASRRRHNPAPSRTIASACSNTHRSRTTTNPHLPASWRRSYRGSRLSGCGKSTRSAARPLSRRCRSASIASWARGLRINRQLWQIARDERPHILPRLPHPGFV